MAKKPSKDDAPQPRKKRGKTSSTDKTKKTPAPAKVTPKPMEVRASSRLVKERLGPVNEAVFALMCQRWADSIEGWTLDTYLEMMLRLTLGVIEKTPWHTGRARSNWRISIGAPAGISIPGPPYPDPVQANVRMLERVNSLKKAERTFLNNNVTYIANLEDGSSRQAPQGMIRPTLIEMASEFGGYLDALDKAVSLSDEEGMREHGGARYRGGEFGGGI